MTESVIHLRVPAAVKGRWIRASRAAGMRLTDWIVQAVESTMLAKIIIPDDVQFADLKMARDPDGHVSFDWAPIERICEASGLDVSVFRDAPEDNASGLITRWYHAHLEAGGEPDPVQEDLLDEVIAEDLRGGGISHQPGRA